MRKPKKKTSCNKKLKIEYTASFVAFGCSRIATEIVSYLNFADLHTMLKVSLFLSRIAAKTLAQNHYLDTSNWATLTQNNLYRRMIENRASFICHNIKKITNLDYMKPKYLSRLFSLTLENVTHLYLCSQNNPEAYIITARRNSHQELKMNQLFTEILGFFDNTLLNVRLGDDCSSSSMKHIFDKLPQGLLELRIDGYRYDSTVGPKFPNSIAILKIRLYSMHYYYYETQLHFPPFLTHLYLCGYDGKLDGSLPESLTYLDTGCQYNKSLDLLPKKLTKLIVSNSFEGTLNKLPDSLRILVFRRLYLFSHKIENVPSSLKKVYFIENEDPIHMKRIYRHEIGLPYVSVYHVCSTLGLLPRHCLE